MRAVNFDLTSGLGNNFLTLSQLHTNTLAARRAWWRTYERPRMVDDFRELDPANSSAASSLTYAIDIVNDSLRVEGRPGQSSPRRTVFNITRGMFENLTERDTVAALSPSGRSSQVDNTYDVFTAAAAQGIGFTDFT